MDRKRDNQILRNKTEIRLNELFRKPGVKNAISKKFLPEYRFPSFYIPGSIFVFSHSYAKHDRCLWLDIWTIGFNYSTCSFITTWVTSKVTIDYFQLSMKVTPLTSYDWGERCEIMLWRSANEPGMVRL